MKTTDRNELCKMAGIDDISDLYDATSEIDSISQNTNKFDNYSLSLRRTESGQVFLHEDQMNDSQYYLVEDSEINNPAEFLRDCASEWALKFGIYSELEMLAWGLKSADDLAVGEDYDGECRVLIERNFYGCSPIDYANDGTSSYYLIFESRQLAQDWINAQEEGTYHLSHNEVGRPVYTITAA